MKRKKVFYSEAAYALGILILALGTALMERADFGVSMVVAPAYLLHLKLSQYLPWYSFGVSEYILQAVLLVALALCMGKFKKGYLFSFLTAVLYGAALDRPCRSVARLRRALSVLYRRYAAVRRRRCAVLPFLLPAGGL